MQIHHEGISDVAKYIQTIRHLTLEDKEQDFQTYLRHIRKFKEVDGNTEILEIGTGTGWFPLLCKANGLRCKGLEISPRLIEYAREHGHKYGLEPDIELGNIEDSEIGESRYDVIVAMSVFEHVEYWQSGLRKIYRALKPGGLLLFESTNRFSFTSGEYDFPLYGWLPDSWRYRLRIARQGKDIMLLGIDFHQFTYPKLRREFREIGFGVIVDRSGIADPDRVANPLKKSVLRLCKNSSLVSSVVLTFMPTTNFACVK